MEWRKREDGGGEGTGGEELGAGVLRAGDEGAPCGMGKKERRERGRKDKRKRKKKKKKGEKGGKREKGGVEGPSR